MTDEYSSKREDALVIAKFAYKQIICAMKTVQSASEYEIDFCWDECLWVNGEFFQYRDLKED